MDPIEEFAAIKHQIRVPEERAAVLRAQFLEPGVRLRSNRHEVVVRDQSRQVFLRDKLPAEVLANPRDCSLTRSTRVSVRALGASRADTDRDLVLIE